MSTYNESAKPKVTTASLRKMKAAGEKIACLTSYDFTMAHLVDAAGIDLILVGDSAANVMMGYETTVPITLDDMITYAKGVVRGVNHAMVVVDMPFGYYQGCPDVALASAVRIMKETMCSAVKMEGGAEIRESIVRILSAGIPVCGHLGLTPQSVNKFGGYGIRAKEDAEAERLISDAKMLDQMGCFAIVLEKVPAQLAARVASEVCCPIIGIGAGSGVDGQILVAQDMLGMNRGFSPKFMRRYADIATAIEEAVGHYVADVKAVDFPNASEQY
ncbi:MAG: 3-methyl-2-oxobutanoate hydroxymethyltransferase [Bacteroides sp.]|nr:3-methyl-2-oxobutanoate hydroxymethyltransferase [Bacteroides sp.]MCM1413823.1 3-methyl-2-oxobutanoate hydroxymethyltransferase [Bacteroides sp.]MCM1471233.1 3-methyl-2-oxobutanoate hydroxymethyltransferase [Bacteroides sp.]